MGVKYLYGIDVTGQSTFSTNVGIGTLSPGAKLDVTGGSIQLSTSGSGVYFGPSSSAQIIGVSGASSYLALGTVGTERVRITSAGNVGIGTTSPSQKLHVVGKALITDDVQLTGSNPRIDFNSNGASSLRFYDTTNASERVRIDTSGNVGIGTTSPTVQGKSTDTTTFGAITVEQSTLFRPSNDLGGTRFGFDSSSNSYIWSAQSGASLNLGTRLAPNNNVNMTLTSSGNVGIGTTSPDALLDIEAAANPTIRLTNSTDPLGAADVGTLEFFTKDSSTGASRVISSIVCINRAVSPSVPDGNLVFKTSVGGAGPVAATEKMRILSDGNVGIGTTSPSTLLHIEGSSTGYLQTIKNTTAGGDYLQMLAETGDAVFQFESGGTGGEATLNMYRDGTQYVKISADAGVDNYFNNGANVGIGTSSPSAKLDVAGTVNAYGNGSVALQWGDTSALGALSFDTSANPVIRSVSSKPLVFQTNGANERMRITSAGNVGIGTTSPASPAGYIAETIDGSSGSFTEYRQNGTALFRIGADSSRPFLYGMTNASMDFYTNTAERMRITAAGDVGIGTTSPASKLDVNGDISITVPNTNTSLLLKRDVSGTIYTYGSFNNVGSDFNINGTGNVFINADSNSDSTSIDRNVTIGNRGVEYMRITSAGNVGIGTATPEDKLHVVGNIRVTNANLSNQENLDVDTGTEVIAIAPIALYTAAFFDFVVKNGANVRSGTVYACHDGTSVEYTETSTADLGNTSAVVFTVDISAGNMRLLATTTTDNWSIKTLTRTI
jgi:hypothetical protein